MIYQKILVIDDDYRTQKSIRLILNNYDITEALSAQNILSKKETVNQYSLILLDVCMRDFNGLEVLHEIRTVNKSIPIIMISGHANLDMVIEALRNKATDFIEKPFKQKQLKEKVKQVLYDHRSQKEDFFSKNTKVEHIQRFVQENLQMASLDYLSENMNLSSKYISRIFKEKSHINFRSYKILLKIEKAKKLLVSSSLSVTEISSQLGYLNPESFMRVFKKQTELTPKQYRNQFRLINKK